jgi:type I restriction enzyme R subunit
MITDRNDLDDQLFDTFAASTQLLRQEPKQVESRDVSVLSIGVPVKPK